MRSKIVFIFVKVLLKYILTVSLPVSGWGHSGDPLRSQGSRVRRLLIIQNWIQEGVEAAAAGWSTRCKWVGVQNYFWIFRALVLLRVPLNDQDYFFSKYSLIRRRRPVTKMFFSLGRSELTRQRSLGQIDSGKKKSEKSLILVTHAYYTELFL